MSTKHTKLPWKAGPVFQKEGRAIFWTDDSKPGKWQRRVDAKDGVFNEADAELIVRACNSHYELLEALRDACAMMERAGAYTDHLRQAIQNATK